jgi:hypothetical protein
VSKRLLGRSGSETRQSSARGIGCFKVSFLREIIFVETSSGRLAGALDTKWAFLGLDRKG